MASRTRLNGNGSEHAYGAGGGGEGINPVELYARAVIDGAIVAGRLVRLACRRFLDDLEQAEARGYRFVWSLAKHAIDFIEALRQSKGRFAMKRLYLSPWQKFIVGNLFGWINAATRKRRFRVGYVEIARKNGKSTLAAALALYLFVGDAEPGAEVYAAATKKDQAKIVWSEAKRMVQKSGALKRRIAILSSNMNIEESASKFEPLGADADTLDGLNVHGAIIDELHKHKTRDVWDVIETATGSRDQPMLVAITTAGFDRNSVCWEQHDYGVQILEGTIADDSFFAFIAGLDLPTREGEEGDDWRDPAVWEKANPNLGISVNPAILAEAVHKANHRPSQRNAILRLNFDVWTESHTLALDLDRWDQGSAAISLEALRGRECFGGLDLSSNRDLTALCWLFHPQEEGEPWQAVWRFWIPGDSVEERVRRDRVPYGAWIDQGLIETTPGNVVDKDWIERRILEDAALYQVREIGYDRLFADQLVTHCMDEGLTMVPFGMGHYSMALPTKELDRLVGPGFRHGGNPVARWMARNMVYRSDPAGNHKPDKEKSREKIDGMVALLIALGRATVRLGAQASPYEERGFRSLGAE